MSTTHCAKCTQAESCWDASLSLICAPDAQKLCATNTLTQLLEAFPNEDWNWWFVSANPNITLDYVKAHPKFPWNWSGLSSNPNITWEMIKAHPEKDWDYHFMALNPSITYDIVLANPDFGWDYDFLSGNPSITWDIIQANPDHPWSYNRFSYNNVTPDIVDEHPEIKWLKIILASNINFTYDWFEKNKGINGQNMISFLNPNLTPDVLNANKHLLQMSGVFILSRNPSFTYEELVKYNVVNYTNLSANPNITFDFIKYNKGLPWNFNLLSSNKFKKHPWFARKRLLNVIAKWRSAGVRYRERYEFEQAQKRYWKGQYNAVMDMLRMRIRDLALGLRCALTNGSAEAVPRTN